MRHDFFDRFSRLDSSIHHLPSSVKLVCSIVIIFTIVIIPIHYQQVFITFFAILILVTFMS